MGQSKNNVLTKEACAKYDKRRETAVWDSWFDWVLIFLCGS